MLNIDRKWYRIATSKTAPDVTEIMIYDAIGAWGISAKDFVSDLNAITSPTIIIKINSGGGDFFDCMAMCNAIITHKSTINTRIEALAASAASLIAICGDVVTISDNAYMMIHNVQSGVWGDSAEMRKQADICDMLNNAVVKAYVGKTGKTEETIRADMSSEKWLDAKSAKDYGLADEIDDGEDGGEAMVMAAKAVAKYPNSPEKLRKFAASLSKNNPPIKESNMNPIISRDGKYFVTVDGKEIEVSAPPAPAPVVQAAAVLTPADIERARTEGAKSERDYARDFQTTVQAVNMTGKALEKFTADFYGTDMKQVKFLASHYLAGRTPPVGEGNGNPEETGAQGDEAKVVASATDRFANDSTIRQTYGIRGKDTNDPAYKNALTRFIAGEKRWANEFKGKLVEFQKN